MFNFKVSDVSKPQGISSAQILSHVLKGKDFSYPDDTSCLWSHHGRCLFHKNNQKVQAANFVCGWEITYKIVRRKQSQFFSVHADNFVSVYYFDCKLCWAGCGSACVCTLGCQPVSSALIEWQRQNLWNLFYKEERFWMTFKLHY